MRHKKWGVIVGIVLLLAVGSTATIVAVKHHNKQAAITKVQTTHEVSYSGKTGNSVLVLLKQHASSVVVKNSSYGAYVDSIDGVKGGTDGKYWMYYVNGKLATVGAGTYKTKQGDQIVWKFE
ncbi:MAG TPA: DUF4430 domain-containing protein [Candidatus Saccharimonadales bacterium]